MAESKSDTYTFVVPSAKEYGLVRSGYGFMGWSENPNAPLQEYSGGATIELNSTSPQKTLYAMWGKEYEISFGLGDGIAGSAPTTTEKVLLANFPYTYTPKTAITAIYKPGYAASGWNEVTFTATNPNPTTTPTWRAVYGGITTMQGMTSTICNNAKQHDSTILTDSRDSKYYWVDKLKDDNCWMTQNLDYDDPGGTKVTSTTGGNGGPSAWSASNENGWKDSDNTRRQYWDPGEKIVNGSTLAAATDSTDRHLLVGNYYSWVSATAGTAPSGSGEASGSICPENWQLPTSNSTTNDKSFGKLLNGLTGATIIQSPYHYIYGGRVYSGRLNDAGSNGYYWSSTAYNGAYAYSLLFSSSDVNPSSYYNRYFGLSVRCVAR